MEWREEKEMQDSRMHISSIPELQTRYYYDPRETLVDVVASIAKAIRKRTPISLWGDLIDPLREYSTYLSTRTAHTSCGSRVYKEHLFVYEEDAEGTAYRWTYIEDGIEVFYIKRSTLGEYDIIPIIEKLLEELQKQGISVKRTFPQI